MEKIEKNVLFMFQFLTKTLININSYQYLDLQRYKCIEVLRDLAYCKCLKLVDKRKRLFSIKLNAVLHRFEIPAPI